MWLTGILDWKMNESHRLFLAKLRPRNAWRRSHRNPLFVDSDGDYLAFQEMNDWSAVCKNCRYRLYRYGRLGTECFAIKHANKEKHEVETFFAGKRFTSYRFGDTLEQSDQDDPPF